MADEAYMAALVKRAQKKDSDAFAKLYVMTYEKQYIYAKRYLRDDDYAQDAVQEAYILALKNIEKLKEPKYFKTWLTKINFRVCYNISVKMRNDCMEDADALEKLLDPEVNSNPEEYYMKELRSRNLSEAIRALPVKEREAVVLKYFAKMSLKEIAENMESSVSSVARYINNGLKILKNRGGVLTVKKIKMNKPDENINKQTAEKILTNIFDANNTEHNTIPFGELENITRKGKFLRVAASNAVICAAVLAAAVIIAVTAVAANSLFSAEGQPSSPVKTEKIEAPAISKAYENNGEIFIELQKGTNDIDFSTVTAKCRGGEPVSVKQEKEGVISIPDILKDGIYDVYLKDVKGREFTLSVTVDMDG